LTHAALEVTLNEQALAEDFRRDTRQSCSVHALCSCCDTRYGGRENGLLTT
jgi:hypothetical protein